MTAVAAFVTDFAEAEAAAAHAAMAEPDDDRYLALRARVTASLGPGVDIVVDRYAVPGGRADLWHPEVDDGIRPRTLLALAAGTSGGAPTWIAYVSGQRQSGTIDHALGIRASGDGFVIVGREAVNPFVDEFAWEAAGGTPVRFDGPPDDVLIERLPDDAEQAAFLRGLGER